MKKIYISILFLLGFSVSCTDFDPKDQGFDLEELPGYVAWNAAGAEAVLDTLEINELAGTQTFNVECPTGNLNPITVTYAFSGTAVFGVDFDVAGATAAGGTLVVPADATDFLDFNNVDLDIDILPDGVVDGDKVLTISLVSAVDSDGTEFAVGRGGTDFLLNAVIVIGDADCPSDLAGTFDVSTVAWCGNPATGVVTWTADVVAGPGVYESDDFSHVAYDACGLATLPGGDLRINDQCGRIFPTGASRWGEIYTFSDLSVAGTDLTFTWVNDYGEGGTNTLTRQDGNDWPTDLFTD